MGAYVFPLKALLKLTGGSTFSNCRPVVISRVLMRIMWARLHLPQSSISRCPIRTVSPYSETAPPSEPARLISAWNVQRDSLPQRADKKRILRPHQRYALNAAFVSREESLDDIENVLFYNVGPSVFRSSSQNVSAEKRLKRETVFADRSPLQPSHEARGKEYENEE